MTVPRTYLVPRVNSHYSWSKIDEKAEAIIHNSKEGGGEVQFAALMTGLKPFCIDPPEDHGHLATDL